MIPVTPESAREGCWCEKYRKPCEYHSGFEAGWEAREQSWKIFVPDINQPKLEGWDVT